MPDPIRKHCGYGQLWPIRASVQPESGRIVYICRIRLPACFSSVSPQKAWIILCKTDTHPAWSGFGQTPLVWKRAGVQESSGPVSGRRQPARYQFPTFRLGSVLPQTSRLIIVQNQPGSDLVLADCVRVWPNGSGPEARRCARIARSASDQCF